MRKCELKSSVCSCNQDMSGCVDKMCCCHVNMGVIHTELSIVILLLDECMKHTPERENTVAVAANDSQPSHSQGHG